MFRSETFLYTYYVNMYVNNIYISLKLSRLVLSLPTILGLRLKIATFY